jgi:hypothetical protein
MNKVFLLSPTYVSYNFWKPSSVLVVTLFWWSTDQNKVWPSYGTGFCSDPAVPLMFSRRKREKEKRCYPSPRYHHPFSAGIKLWPQPPPRLTGGGGQRKFSANLRSWMFKNNLKLINLVINWPFFLCYSNYYPIADCRLDFLKVNTYGLWCFLVLHMWGGGGYFTLLCSFHVEHLLLLMDDLLLSSLVPQLSTGKVICQLEPRIS